MSRYRFRITANGFELAFHYSEKEEGGLNWCKRYMGRFQRTVVNMPLKVDIYAKEKQPHIWDYHNKPYIFVRTLVKRPLVKKSDDPDK